MNHEFLGRRKRLALLVTTSLLALGVTAGSASGATQTFTNPTQIDVPDAAIADPYPSSINVSGFAGNVENAAVTFNGFDHTCFTDVATLLVAPNGAAGVPFAFIGPCPPDPQVPLTLTFNAKATNVFAGESGSGTYIPGTDGTPVELSEPAPAGPHETLNAVNQTPANGTWSLYIEDQAGGDKGVVNGGWSLTLSAPKNDVTTGAVTQNNKKGTARVPVNVADDGKVTLTGNGVATVAAPGANAAADVFGPGTITLPVKATGKKKQKLNQKGKVTVNVTITFTPRGTGVTPKSTALTVTLKKKIKK
jgi:hypothetical protein